MIFVEFYIIFSIVNEWSQRPLAKDILYSYPKDRPLEPLPILPILYSLRSLHTTFCISHNDAIHFSAKILRV